MIRLLFLTHRYLGIAMGLVITLWCLSGSVMMYVQYPDLNDQEQLTGLETLNFSTCCQIPNDFSTWFVEVRIAPDPRILERRAQPLSKIWKNRIVNSV